MKKPLTLALALLLCLGIFPVVTNAGSMGPWKGGQTGHDHQISSSGIEYLDDTYHQEFVYCTCGAKATFGSREKHDLKYICPLTDDPQHRDIYECSKCHKMVFKKGKTQDATSDKLYELKDWQGVKERNVMDCIECRCCEYICSSKIPLVTKIKAGKQAVREMK